MRNPHQWYRDVQRRGRPLLTATALLLGGALLVGVSFSAGQAWQQRAMEDFFCETAEVEALDRDGDVMVDMAGMLEYNAERLRRMAKGRER